MRWEKIILPNGALEELNKRVLGDPIRAILEREGVGYKWYMIRAYYPMVVLVHKEGRGGAWSLIVRDRPTTREETVKMQSSYLFDSSHPQVVEATAILKAGSG